VKGLRKTFIENEIYFSYFPYKIFPENISHPNKNSGRYYRKIIEKVVPHVKYTSFLFDLIQN